MQLKKSQREERKDLVCSSLREDPGCNGVNGSFAISFEGASISLLVFPLVSSAIKNPRRAIEATNGPP